MRLSIALLALSISTPALAQDFGSTSGATSMVNVSSPAETTSTSRVITTPTVVAPGLAAAGVETCLGSASGGLSLMGGGFTFGGTMVDEGCTIRLLARQLFAFGLKNAALALMCQDDRVAAAMDAVGTPCPPAPAEFSRRRVAAVAANSFAPEDRTNPLAHDEQGNPLMPAAPASARAPDPQADSFTQEAQLKPLTRQEQLLFDRESSMQ